MRALALSTLASIRQLPGLSRFPIQINIFYDFHRQISVLFGDPEGFRV